MPAESFIDQTKYLFSPDGHTLATWANADTVDLWDLDTGAPRMAPLRTGNAVNSVTFSRDGRVLLTSSDGLARVWDASTGELLAEPTLQLRGVPAVAISPDGSHVVIGTGEGALHQFRLSHSRNSAPDRPGHAVPSARSFHVARTRGLPMPFLPGSPTRVLWMADDHARIIELASGRELGRFAYPDRIKSAAVRADGRVAVVQTLAGAWRVWWFGSGGVERVAVLGDNSTESAWVVFSPTNDRAALSRARHIRVWSLQSGQPVSPEIPSTLNNWYSQFASFSPDGQRLLVGSIEGSARVWDVASGKALLDFGHQPTNITQAMFSPDGTRIVSGSRFSAIRLWEGATGKPISSDFQQPGMYGQGVFSGDSRTVATFTADRGVVLRDSRNGAVLQSIEADGSLRCVRFSSDDTRLLTTTSEGTAQVWDARVGLPVSEPLRHGMMRVDAGEISPDGLFVRTETSPDERFEFWAIPPPTAPGERAPDWLLELATFCAGKRVDENGQLQSTPAASGRLEALRATIENLAHDAAYATWGRWFFADPATRSIAPGFVMPERRAREASAKLVQSPAKN